MRKPVQPKGQGKPGDWRGYQQKRRAPPNHAVYFLTLFRMARFAH
jgi:hypothetical protein